MPALIGDRLGPPLRQLESRAAARLPRSLPPGEHRRAASSGRAVRWLRREGRRATANRNSVSAGQGRGHDAPSLIVGRPHRASDQHLRNHALAGELLQYPAQPHMTAAVEHDHEVEKQRVDGSIPTTKRNWSR